VVVDVPQILHRQSALLVCKRSHNLTGFVLQVHIMELGLLYNPQLGHVRDVIAEFLHRYPPIVRDDIQMRDQKVHQLHGRARLHVALERAVNVFTQESAIVFYAHLKRRHAFHPLCVLISTEIKGW
jgi:hypothetical protein